MASHPASGGSFPRGVELDCSERLEGLPGCGGQPVNSVMQRATSGLVVAIIDFITHHFLHRSGSEIERATVGTCGGPVLQKLEFMRGEPRNAGTFGKNSGAVFDEL